MQKTYTSLYAQMAYVIISGLPLVFAPNLLLPLVGFAPTAEPWIQVMGLLVLALSPYYYAMAQHGTVPVVRATVWGRLFFCVGLVMLVVLGQAKLPLIGFALTEIGLALWTWRELRL